MNTLMRAWQTFGCAAALLVCVAAVSSAQGRSEVADAAQRGDRATLQKLIQAKSNVNATQVDGSTALQWAVYREDPEMVDLLIRAGADVKAANRQGATPLMMASIYGHQSIIDRLLKAGADAKSLGPNGETMVMFAARNGNPGAIKLLIEAGANVNAREPLRGTTALMWATEQKHPEAVKTLLAAGADPALKSAAAGTPRPYMAGRVNARVVDEARERRARALAAGRTYDEQFEFERANGVAMLGQRGLGTPLGPDGQPLPQGGAASSRAEHRRRSRARHRLHRRLRLRQVPRQLGHRAHPQRRRPAGVVDEAQAVAVRAAQAARRPDVRAARGRDRASPHRRHRFLLPTMIPTTPKSSSPVSSAAPAAA